MAIGSIVVRHNPVTLWERFMLTLAPEDGKFSEYSQEDRTGGYYRANFNVFFDHVAASEFLESGLGRHVDVYDDQSIKVFEGFIFEIVRDTGKTLSSISLQNTVNKVFMRADHDGDQVTERSTVLQSAESQGRFGIKDNVLTGGEVASLSVADQGSQQYINWRSYPIPEPEIGAGSGVPHLKVFCRGYIETLSWRVYNSTDTGNQSANAQIQDILDDVAQFVDSYELEANSTLIAREYDADRRALDIINSIVAFGDSHDRKWVAYMTDNRKFIFRDAAPAEILTGG